MSILKPSGSHYTFDECVAMSAARRARIDEAKAKYDEARADMYAPWGKAPTDEVALEDK